MWSCAFPTLLPAGLYHIPTPDPSEARSGRGGCEVDAPPIDMTDLLCGVAYRSVFPVGGGWWRDTRAGGTPPSSAHPLTPPIPTSSVVPPPRTDGNLGYGEILPASVVSAVLYLRRTFPGGRPWRKVVDLGSGNGRALFAASLAHPFASAVGIEIVPSLHDEAERGLGIWKGWSVEGPICDCEDGSVAHPPTEFGFIRGDFTSDQHSRIVSDADLVIAHSTLFDDNLMAKVENICRRCRPGTFFLMVTRPLTKGVAPDGIRTVLRTRLDMDWGTAEVYLQRM